MYALQRPRFRFPEDISYFCRTDIDDSAIFMKNDSPFRRVEDIVAEAKRRPLNVAVSRIPHPASIGMLALGEAQGARFNLIPYGGGSPTLVAVMNSEADIGALPVTGLTLQTARLKVLGVFARENVLADLTNNAPTINQVFAPTSRPVLLARLGDPHARHRAFSRPLPDPWRARRSGCSMIPCSASRWRRLVSRRRRCASATGRPAPNTPPP